MDKRLLRPFLVGCALSTGLVCGAASAGTEDDFLLPSEMAAAAAAPAPAMEPGGLTFGSAPVSVDALDTQRGGTETLNDMDLDGVVGNNYAANLVTGNNVVTEGSLTNNAGFNTVIQNSGNNVLIQNATILNLKVQ